MRGSSPRMKEVGSVQYHLQVWRTDFVEQSRRALRALSTTLLTSGSNAIVTPVCSPIRAISRMAVTTSAQVLGRPLSGWCRHMFSGSHVPLHNVMIDVPSRWQCSARILEPLEILAAPFPIADR